LFAALDLLAMPSLSEGFPNVLGEAMACGIPCVATEVGESRSIVGDTGALVPPGDPGAMAAALDDLLGLDQADRLERGRRCRDRIAERYSLKEIAGRYGELYTSA
jgi:glycosyltransferase involved in cell wall biosynthesis